MLSNHVRMLIVAGPLELWAERWGLGDQASDVSPFDANERQSLMLGDGVRA